MSHDKSLNVPFLALSRFGGPLVALVLLASACGGQGPMDEQSSALVKATTHFVLTGVDAQVAAPFFTCTTATETTELDSGTLATTATDYTAVFGGTDTRNGVTAATSWQDKGKVSVNGDKYAFTSPGHGTFTGTPGNGTLTVSGVPYCGGSHTLVYQQQ